MWLPNDPASDEISIAGVLRPAQGSATTVRGRDTYLDSLHTELVIVEIPEAAPSVAHMAVSGRG